MTYKIDAEGWFSEIGNRKVIKRDMRYLGATTYRRGFPEGLLWHYTAACNADISGGMIARGYATACGSIGLGGDLFQYLPIDVAGYHAYDASHVYFGLEHAALPGTCELTDVELQASAEYAAAVVDAVEQRHHFTIPLVHVPGCDIITPGFKEHADGVGCPWNPKTHTDNLYGWGWPRYLEEVAIAQEDDMSAEDKLKLEKAAVSAARFEDYLDGQQLVLAGKPLPADHSQAMGAGFQVMTAAVNRPQPGQAHLPKSEVVTIVRKA